MNTTASSLTRRRNYILRKGQGGFTLIELMIVVAIVGILAVLAVYGVRKYIANAKTTEARNSLGQIGKDSSTAYEGESMAGAPLTLGVSTAILRSLCLPANGPVPTAMSSLQGKKYQSNPEEWAVDTGAVHKGFACLRFVMNDPQYYQYMYNQTGNPGDATGRFEAVAQGDLNGDGVVFSKFSLLGQIQTSGAGLVLTVAPAITEEKSDE